MLAQLDQIALDEFPILGQPGAVAAERGERGQAGRRRSLEPAAQEALFEGGERGAAPDEPNDRIGRRSLGLVERAEPGVPAAAQPLEAGPLGRGQLVEQILLGRARRGRARGPHGVAGGLDRLGVGAFAAEGGCGHGRPLG